MSTPNPAAVVLRPSRLLGSTGKVTVLVITSVSTAGTALADVLGVDSWQALPWLCAVGWLLAVLALLIATGMPDADEDPDAETRVGQYPRYLRYGWKRACERKGFLVAVVVMSIGAAYAAYLNVNRDGGLLHQILKEVRDTNRKADEILLEMRTKTPQERIRATGVEASPAGWLDAFWFGMVDSLKAFNEWEDFRRQPLKPGDGWDLFELMLDNDNIEHGEVLKAARLTVEELNRPLAYVNYRDDFPPQRRALFAAYGANPDGLALLQNVTPLLYAVWRHRTDAVRAMLEQGADPSLAASIVTGSRITPLSEARRLGYKDIEALLLEAGAQY